MQGPLFLLTELPAVRALLASNAGFGPAGSAPWVGAALDHLGDLENEWDEGEEEGKRRILGILVANEKPTSSGAEFAIPLTVARFVLGAW